MTYKEQLNEFKSQDRLNHVEIAIALEVESYFENASDDEFESICSYIKRIYLKYGHAEISQLVYCFASLFGNGKSINEILDIILIDRSSGKNLIWATSNYSLHGRGYHEDETITPKLITGRMSNLIKPRTNKSQREQKKRSNLKS